MKIKLKIECKSCGGTGVYQGIGEMDGAGVVCYSCNGTGCQNYVFDYEKFTKRKTTRKVKRVFLSGYGYCVGIKPITLDSGIYVDFSKEGVSYKDFLNGKQPQHIKTMVCPLLADQGACHSIKGFHDKCVELNGGCIGVITSCKYSMNKNECWERFKKGENK